MGNYINSNKVKPNLLINIYNLKKGNYIRLNDKSEISFKLLYTSEEYHITSDSSILLSNNITSLEIKNLDIFNEEIRTGKIFANFSLTEKEDYNIAIGLILYQYYGIIGVPTKIQINILLNKFNSMLIKFNSVVTEKYFNLDSERWNRFKTKKNINNEMKFFTENDKRFLIFNTYLAKRNNFVSIEVKDETKHVVIEVKDEVKNTNVEVKEEGKLNWQKQRMRVWIDESIKLQKWGIDNYVNGHTGKCFCCHKTINDTNHEAGHIIPRAHHGTDELDNMRIICKECNRGKGGMFEINAYEFMYINNKPGISTVKFEDPNHIIGLLLHRETLLLKTLKGKGLVDEEISSPKIQMQPRLEHNWDLFSKAFEKL